MRKTFITALALSAQLPQASAQSGNSNSSTPIKSIADPVTSKESEKKWYQSINMRGYIQFRYNRLFETNENLTNEQGDRSWGKNGGFFIRRARVILFGQLSKQVYFYFQPDFASSPTTDRLHFAQIRDAYIDLGVDKNNEFRFRVGQSKVPYGFENMQSSQNRLPLDRQDALNSAVANERDLGVFFYYAPKKIRERFAYLVSSGLKGSGDYGVFGFGAYNGQTANSPELNNNRHLVARLAYPFQFKKQIVELGIQGYSGNFVVSSLSANVKAVANRNYLDQRVAATAVLYPQPFGIQAEYNIGKGPEFNKVTDSIEVRNLSGGYVLLNFKTSYKNHLFYPFVRYHQYQGGKKHERDARSYDVHETEIGVEWQPVKNFELVAMYTISSRRFEDFQNQDNFQKGRLLRLQAQLNF